MVIGKQPPADWQAHLYHRHNCMYHWMTPLYNAQDKRESPMLSLQKFYWPSDPLLTRKLYYQTIFIVEPKELCQTVPKISHTHTSLEVNIIKAMAEMSWGSVNGFGGPLDCMELYWCNLSCLYSSSIKLMLRKLNLCLIIKF